MTRKDTDRCRLNESDCEPKQFFIVFDSIKNSLIITYDNLFRWGQFIFGVDDYPYYTMINFVPYYTMVGTALYND